MRFIRLFSFPEKRPIYINMDRIVSIARCPEEIRGDGYKIEEFTRLHAGSIAMAANDQTSGTAEIFFDVQETPERILKILDQDETQ